MATISIQRRGFLSGRRCAKIQRVRRPLSSDECHAAVTAADFAFLYQVLLVELLTRRYQMRKLRHPTICSTLNPFWKPPEWRKLKRGQLFMTHQEFGPVITRTDENIRRSQNFRKSRRIGMDLFTAERVILSSEAVDDSGDLEESSELPKPLVLADCCSLFRRILRMQQNAQERRSRIILAHMRCLRSMMGISSADAAVNLGDVGAKRGASIAILRRFANTGRCEISFVGRKARGPVRRNEVN